MNDYGIENASFFRIRIGDNPLDKSNILTWFVGQVLPDGSIITDIFVNFRYQKMLGYAPIQIWKRKKNGAEVLHRQYSPFYKLELTPLKDDEVQSDR